MWIKKLLLAVLLLSPAAFAQTPIYCQPAVIRAMRSIWQATGNGTQMYEASFALSGSPDDPSIYMEPYTGETLHQSVRTFADTFALFHVHPTGSSPLPSTPLNNYLGDRKGDTGIADQLHLDIYVVSNQALSVYYWQTRETVIVRQGLSWSSAKGCQ